MRTQFNLFALLLASGIARADRTINMTPGVTPISHDIYSLHMTIFWICVVIGIVVFGVMLYSILFHRKSLGHKAHAFHENTWVELAWTFIPLVILIVMAIPATQVLLEMNDTEKEDLTIKITGSQWKWQYEYLDQGIKFFSNINTPLNERSGKAPLDALYLRTVDHVLVVPIHKKIRFLVTSNDVIHSWFVPDLGVKRDALPGYINETWARVNRPGIYFGQCTELCGINHAFMPIVVLAVPEQVFNAWVAGQKGEAPPPVLPAPTTTPTPTTTAPTAATTAAPATPGPAKQYTKEELMQKGEQVYLSICAACHQPTGMGMPPTFPALNGSAIVNGPVSGHIDRVMNGKPGTAMQAFKEQLSDEDIASVITYERNSWDNKTGTVVQPSDIQAARGK